MAKRAGIVASLQLSLSGGLWGTITRILFSDGSEKNKLRHLFRLHFDPVDRRRACVLAGRFVERVDSDAPVDDACWIAQRHLAVGVPTRRGQAQVEAVVSGSAQDLCLAEEQHGLGLPGLVAELKEVISAARVDQGRLYEG